MKKLFVVAGVGVAGLVGAAVYFFTEKKPEAVPAEVPKADTNGNDFANVNLSSPTNFAQSISDGISSMLSSTKRGIKNNNPTNMKWSSVINWQGQTGKDSLGFIIFDTPENGIRAAAKNLKSYAKAGLVTIPQIINRWSETDQAAYIKNVSAWTGISLNAAVTVSQYPLLIAAMIRQENGEQPYSMQTIIAGVNAS